MDLRVKRSLPADTGKHETEHRYDMVANAASRQLHERRPQKPRSKLNDVTPMSCSSPLLPDCHLGEMEILSVP